MQHGSVLLLNYVSPSAQFIKQRHSIKTRDTGQKLETGTPQLHTFAAYYPLTPSLIQHCPCHPLISVALCAVRDGDEANIGLSCCS